MKKLLTGLQAKPVYAVALTGRDAPGTLHGPLAAARREFFEHNRTVRRVGTDHSRGVTVKYNGKISRGGVRWKERAANGAYCRTFDLRGEDALLFYDAYGRLTRRMVFSGAAWLRSDYFDPGDCSRAAEILAADPAGDAILHYTRRPGEDTYDLAVLVPVQPAADAALQSYVNSKLGEPVVQAVMARGELLFCREEEKAEREALCAAGLPVEEPLFEEETPCPGEEAAPAEEAMLPDVTEEQTEEQPEDAPPAPEEAAEEAAPAEAEEAPAEEPAVLAEEDALAAVETGVMLAEPAEADLTLERGTRVYRYVGRLENGRRHGRGRTEQENGLTAYDGEYAEDKKEGFGSLYYKNGGLCYAGSWKNDRRHGLGVSFRKEDNSLHVGKWQDGNRVGMDFLFDKDGRLCVIRDSGDGEGKTVFCIDNAGTVITGLPDAPGNGRGSEFDDDGNIVYTGMHKDGLRHGEGTSFHPDGQIEFTGQWENGVFVEGIAFGPNGAGKYKAIL